MSKKWVCLISAFLVLGPVWAVQATVTPVGWWKPDEKTGTPAADSSANKNDGTLVNGAAWAIGQLDGANDYVNLPIGRLISTLNSASLTIWANFQSGGSWTRIWDIGTGETVNVFLTPAVGTAGALRFAITTGGSGAESQRSASSMLASGWHHVAVVINGDTRNMQLYLDGSVAATGTTATLPSNLGNTTQNWLGRSQYPADGYYSGRLDDFRIFDRTLTPDEIQKVMKGTGYETAGEHSTSATDMWLSGKGAAQGTCIQYAFDKAYKLDKMLVWNSNQALELVVGCGAKDVTVEYSVDGTTWTKLGNVEFVEAPGDATCTADTKVAFGGIAVKFVKLTIKSNWGGVLARYGLSEVQFSYLPVRATELSPASGTSNLDSPVTLNWRPGRQAVTHEVYLGTDAKNLPLFATTDKTSYAAKVAVGNVYYWKIVEVNEAATPSRWESDVANFSTVAVPTNPGTANLKHLYAFDDGTAKDSVGKADGVLVGGAAVVDGALVTAAQDQWMKMPGKTIAMWYTPKANGNTGYTMLAYFGGSVGGLGSNGYFMCSARGDNVSRTAISIGNTSAPWSAESGANGPEYDDGKPHCMVSTMDATTIKLYVDGVLTASTALSATNKISGISQNLAYLAKGGYTGDPEWIGSLQEFRIYNKALTAGEVRNLAGQR